MLLEERIARIETMLEEISDLLQHHLTGAADKEFKRRAPKKIERVTQKEMPPGFRMFLDEYRVALTACNRSLRGVRAALGVWSRRNLEAHAGAIVDRLRGQVERYREKKAAGAFSEDFPDAHRWLRDSRWHDE